MQAVTSPKVRSVSRDEEHRFSKPVVPSILLVAGVGVQGDAHAGVTAQHRSRPRTESNLRQVHLIAAELHDELAEQGYRVTSGQLGENVTTHGVDLLALSRGTLLRLGRQAVVEVTGLRNPCRQIDDFRPGLLQAVLYRDANGHLVRKVGIMGVVRRGGEVKPGDPIAVEPPIGPHQPLAVV